MPDLLEEGKTYKTGYDLRNDFLIALVGGAIAFFLVQAIYYAAFFITAWIGLFLLSMYLFRDKIFSTSIKDGDLIITNYFYQKKKISVVSIKSLTTEEVSRHMYMGPTAVQKVAVIKYGNMLETIRIEFKRSKTLELVRFNNDLALAIQEAHKKM